MDRRFMLHKKKRTTRNKSAGHHTRRFIELSYGQTFIAANTLDRRRWFGMCNLRGNRCCSYNHRSRSSAWLFDRSTDTMRQRGRPRWCIRCCSSHRARGSEHRHGNTPRSGRLRSRKRPRSCRRWRRCPYRMVHTRRCPGHRSQSTRSLCGSRCWLRSYPGKHLRRLWRQ